MGFLDEVSQFLLGTQQTNEGHTGTGHAHNTPPLSWAQRDLQVAVCATSRVKSPRARNLPFLIQFPSRGFPKQRAIRL